MIATLMAQMTSRLTEDRADGGGARRFGPLSRKYFGAFLLTVLVPLSVSGGIEAWLGYEEQKRSLQQLLQDRKSVV